MSSRSPENILLRLPDTEEEQVRRIFDALEQRGFPRQHQRPHISVTFAPRMRQSVVESAAALLPPLLPARLDRVGTVVFGTKSKQTVAWLLEAPEALERAARQLSAENPDGRGERWVPHLTLGLRLPKSIVPGYIGALAEVTNPHIRALTADRAVYYRPTVGQDLQL